MRIFLPAAPGLAMALLLAAGPVALAQQVPAGPPTPPAEAPTVPVAAPRPGPLLKLGTGLLEGSGYGSYNGLSLPLVLGIEQQLAPGWSATLNGVSLWNVGRRDYFGSSKREGLNLRGLSVDAGIRHYYHRQKRQAKGRRTGPYQGPYVALQLNNHFDRTYYAHSKRRLEYDYSSLTLQWGVQRRLGGRGLLDAYIGGGVANQRTFTYEGSPTGQYRRYLTVGLEVGAKVSLTNK